MNMFRYFVEITLFNHLNFFSQLIHSYFTANIWFFSHVHVWFWITCVKDRMDVSCNILVFLKIVFRWSFRWKKQPFNPIRIHLRAHFKLANNAVDRNTDTCTRTRAIGYGAQFNVVLGRVHNIYSINILFKNDHGDGMYTYNPPKKTD